MRLTIVTGGAATGKTHLVNKLTIGLRRYDWASTIKDPAVIEADYKPEVLVFEDGVASIDMVIDIIKASLIFCRGPILKTYKQPVPDMFIVTNGPYDPMLQKLKCSGLFEYPEFEYSHIHMKRI